jgi:hypothetical protein
MSMVKHRRTQALGEAGETPVRKRLLTLLGLY